MQVNDVCGRRWLATAMTMALATASACGLDAIEQEQAFALRAEPAYPLRRGPEGSRYLVGQNGAPFLWAGDTAWSLIAQLSLEDARGYLDDRKAKGFNVILVNLLEHHFAARAPANIAGDAPFNSRPFTSPNERYFSHADDVIRAAGQRGIAVLLDPLYLGYGCNAQGWCGEVHRASEADMYSWGRYLGSRYSAFDNIVWLIGGDTDPSPVRGKVLAMVRGIRDTDSRHLMTAHNDETTARRRWPNQDWLTIDNVYSYNPALHTDVRSAYAATPAMPFFLLESTYEREHGVTDQHLRAQAYWTMLSGAMGHIFGNCPIWHFGASPNWCGTGDWRGNLNSSGSTHAMYFHRLFGSRPWHTLIPDLRGLVLTSGQSSGTDLATAARAADGATVIAYIPSQRPVTIDMTKVGGGTATAWWYAPVTGVATKLGTFPTTGSRTFWPPGGDSVLVIDDASRGFGAPGMLDGSEPPAPTPPPAPQPPAPQPPSLPPSVTPPTIAPGSDTVVDFESANENVLLTTEGGVRWPTSGVRWNVWYGGAKYSKNAYIDSRTRSEVAASFTLPKQSILKSLRIAVGSGASAQAVTISSPGNPDRVFTDITGTYKTKRLDWTTPSSTITIKVTCNTVWGASDLAFDTLTYTTLPASVFVAGQ